MRRVCTIILFLRKMLCNLVFLATPEIQGPIRLKLILVTTDMASQISHNIMNTENVFTKYPGDTKKHSISRRYTTG